MHRTRPLLAILLSLALCAAGSTAAYAFTLGSLGSTLTFNSLDTPGDFIGDPPPPSDYAIGADGAVPDWDTLKDLDGILNAKRRGLALAVHNGQYEMRDRDYTDKTEHWNIIPTTEGNMVRIQSVAPGGCMTVGPTGPQPCATPDNPRFKKQVFVVIPSNTDYLNNDEQGFVFKNPESNQCLSMKKQREKNPFRSCEDTPADHEVHYFSYNDESASETLMTIARTYAITKCSAEGSDTCDWLDPRTTEDDQTTLHQCALDNYNYTNETDDPMTVTLTSVKTTGWSNSFSGDLDFSMEIGVPLVGKLTESVEMHQEQIWSSTASHSIEIDTKVQPHYTGWMTLAKTVVPMEGTYRFSGLGLPWTADATVYVPIESGTQITAHTAPEFLGCDGLPAPEITKLPEVTGAERVGSTVHATNGTWNLEPDKYSYQWLRDGAPIRTTTNRDYTLTGHDKGHTIAVVVMAKLDGHDGGKAKSEEYGPVK